ncbi:uncharacterized protein LOC120078246 [Benincasa hispida]|uniref:uncharacterized protein LOC120078246 n=1 Tax=Benincasa hispida TaxID=102211 RepID=UPI001901D222|nr:uncharacterized protein LOC120078246 [Benincasa hispida]
MTTTDGGFARLDLTREDSKWWCPIPNRTKEYHRIPKRFARVFIPTPFLIPKVIFLEELPPSVQEKKNSREAFLYRSTAEHISTFTSDLWEARNGKPHLRSIANFCRNFSNSM